MGKWLRWTSEDDELFREVFGEPGGPKKLAEEFGISLPAVWFHAHCLGLRRGRRVTRQESFVEAPPPRPDLLKTMVCPGRNGHGCGARLRTEMVPSGYGYIAPGEMDLVCVAGHRFRL